MRPFRQNSTISHSVPATNRDDFPEITIESTMEKLLEVRNRLQGISERSQALETGVQSLRRVLTAQAQRDSKNALGKLEELRQIREAISSAKKDNEDELRKALGRILFVKDGEMLEDNEASVSGVLGCNFH
ncbi:GL24968 [Drosophila persimilis]|uniref:GL24968 n=1 Tax=Drosophila persimilis TaxID=7234 RepID=B4GRC9_DROPE|nr:GL24968 [Drosophila persimilis]